MSNGPPEQALLSSFLRSRSCLLDCSSLPHFPCYAQTQCQVAFPKLSGQLIDVAIASQQQGGSRAEAQHAINVILGEVVAVVCVSGVAGGLRSWLFQSAAERVMFRLRSRLFAALLAQEVGFYDRVRTGEAARLWQQAGVGCQKLSNQRCLDAGIFSLLGAFHLPVCCWRYLQSCHCCGQCLCVQPPRCFLQASSTSLGLPLLSPTLLVSAACCRRADQPPVRGHSADAVCSHHSHCRGAASCGSHSPGAGHDVS